MRIEGQQSFAAGQEALWSLLQDPVILPRLLPGCESLEAVSTHEYRGTLILRVGQAVESFTGVLSLERLSPPHSFDFRAEGRNSDGAASARGHITLQTDGPETTTLVYNAEFDVTGRPSSVSPRMLQTTARAFARRALESLQQQVAIRTRVYTTTTTRAEPAAAAAPSSTAIDHLVFQRRVAMVICTLLAALFVMRRAGRQRERLVAQPVAELLDQSGVTTIVSEAGSRAATSRGIT